MINPYELLFGFASNIHNGFTFLYIITSIVLGLSLVAVCVCWTDGYSKDSEKAVSIRLLKWTFPVWLLVGMLASIPTIDDIWKVRIGVLKLQLASPQNIQKGAEEIARIGHRLECQYLGCEEEKKQEKR